MRLGALRLAEMTLVDSMAFATAAQAADEAGRYEVRFLDVSGREVLGRSVVEVK